MYLYGIDWENLPEGQVIGIYYHLSAELGLDELPLTCPCGTFDLSLWQMQKGPEGY